MKNIIKGLAILLLSNVVLGQATNLPDISVIGNFLGTSSTDSNSFDVKEIEFSYQHYLYPGVKVNIFTALHKEDSGARDFHLEESYVDFANLTELFFENSPEILHFGSSIGKKYLAIGKVNLFHPEQWDFIDRSYPSQYVLGGDENLSAEGGQLTYLLPLPFFSQIELGYWSANNSSHDESQEHSSIEYTNRFLTSRLWNGFELNENNEIEIGISNLIGNVGANEDQQQSLTAIDLTYQSEHKNNKFKLSSEVYFANYGEDNEAPETQDGYFVSTSYTFNQAIETGLRYGQLGKHGDEGSTKTQWSYMLGKQLTETSKFKIQYNTGENIENTLLAQFIFGMGPHAHVLQ